MTLKEKGFQHTKSVPVAEAKNPARGYSATEPSNVLALNQKKGPAEDAYQGQKKHDDENLTIKEKGYQQTKTIPVAEAKNPARGYSADEPSNVNALAQMTTDLVNGVEQAALAKAEELS